ncbi:MAG: hypothetical protein ACOY35_00935, partial [Bacillota bacterium]
DTIYPIPWYEDPIIAVITAPAKAAITIGRAAAKAVGTGISKGITKGAGKVQAPQKVIGHYPEYVEMSSKLGTKPFSIPDNIWSKMSPSLIYRAVGNQVHSSHCILF